MGRDVRAKDKCLRHNKVASLCFVMLSLSLNLINWYLEDCDDSQTRSSTLCLERVIIFICFDYFIRYEGTEQTSSIIRILC